MPEPLEVSTTNSTALPSMFLHQVGVLKRQDPALARWLSERGIRTEWCTYPSLIAGKYPLDSSVLVSGAVPFVHAALEAVGATPPSPLGFPTAVQPWLHREIELVSAAEAIERATAGKIFVKPAGELKAFNGGLTDDLEVVGALRSQSPERTLWISEPITFLSEWRVFVIDGAIRAVEQYVPDIDVVLWPKPTAGEIEELVTAAFEATGRVGMSVDVGRLPDGSIALVELNDGYSLGSYDLTESDYFDLIWARWRQMVAPSNTACTQVYDLS